MNRRLLLVAIACLGLSACKPKAADTAAEQAFMAAKAKEPGVVTTASGLAYKVLKSGPADGAHPKPLDAVSVMYEGRLIPHKNASGKEVPGLVFDSSYDRGQPIVVGVADPDNPVIAGWDEVLQLMRPGDVWEVYIPAKLGYGDEGKDPVPPGATMIFKMEIISVLSRPPVRQ